MYINKVIPFIITTSHNIHFGTAEMIKNEKKCTMMTSLKQIIDAYNARGFKIKHILADRQFECLRKNLECEGIILNTTALDKHVPEVERYICTIKERARNNKHTTI